MLAYHSCIGLAAIENSGTGLMHGDYKPENLVLLYGLPRIGDFGSAHLREGALGTGLDFGTPEYLAPECRGTGVVDSPAGDVYSFGVVGQELIAGSEGLDEPTALTRIRTEMPDLFAQCGSSLPSQRPQGFLDVKRNLQEVLRPLQELEARWICRLQSAWV